MAPPTSGDSLMRIVTFKLPVCNHLSIKCLCELKRDGHSQAKTGLWLSRESDKQPTIGRPPGSLLSSLLLRACPRSHCHCGAWAVVVFGYAFQPLGRGPEGNH